MKYLLNKTCQIIPLCLKKNLISLRIRRIIPRYVDYESFNTFIAEFQVFIGVLIYYPTLLHPIRIKYRGWELVHWQKSCLAYVRPWFQSLPWVWRTKN